MSTESADSRVMHKIYAFISVHGIAVKILVSKFLVVMEIMTRR